MKPCSRPRRPGPDPGDEASPDRAGGGPCPAVRRAAAVARSSSARGGLGMDLGMGDSAPSGQDVGHRDLADLDAIDHYAQHMAGCEDFVRLVAVRSRVGVHIDLAVVHVDDPVDGDPRLPVDVGQRRSLSRLETDTSATRATSVASG